jgi:hypothetical protein
MEAIGNWSQKTKSRWWLRYCRRYTIGRAPFMQYMARGNGTTFQGSLPIAKKYHVAAINWGLVAGKTQT